MIDEAMTHKVKLTVNEIGYPKIWLDGFEVKHLISFNLELVNLIRERRLLLTFKLPVVADGDRMMHTIRFTEQGQILLDHFMLRWVKCHSFKEAETEQKPLYYWLEVTLLVRSVNG